MKRNGGIISSTQLATAIRAAEHRREHATTCPKCVKSLALLSLTFLSYRVAYLCRFCDYVEFNLGTKGPEQVRRR